MMLNKEMQAVNQLTMKYSGIGYLYKPFSWDDFYKWIPEKGMTKEIEVTGKSLDLLDGIVQGFQQGDFGVAYDRLYQVCQYTYEHSDSQLIASELYELVDQVQHKVLDTHILKLHTMVSKIQLEPVHTKYAEGLGIWTFKIVDFLFMKLYQGKQEILHNVLYYIHTHIQEDISLKDIVVSCNVSQGYISRIFKHKLNMTIMQYIHKKKINLAKEYILGTEKSGSYIANILGYSDVSYFCKIFGQDELTKKVDLKQPGQYAANETVTLVGPKGSIEKVRILGPFRNDTQVEISLTDSFTLGVPGVIRESGDLRETPGITLLGPKGKLTISQGVIVAHRHIHMHPDDARRMGVVDKERVTVTVHGERELTFSNVIIRVSPKFALEMHIDVDEANAGRIKNNDIGIVSKS